MMVNQYLQTNYLVLKNFKKKVRSRSYLQLRHIMPSQKLHKAWDNTSFNYFINWRAAFYKMIEAKQSTAQRGMFLEKELIGNRIKLIPIDNSFLNCVVASNCNAGSSDHTPCTIEGILSNCQTTPISQVKHEKIITTIIN